MSKTMTQDAIAAAKGLELLPVIQTKAITMVCRHCGSLDVTADACARWDADTQAWEMVTTYDNTDCQSCGGETRLEERPVGFDPFSEGFHPDRYELCERADGGVDVTHYPPNAVRGDGVLIAGVAKRANRWDTFAKARDVAAGHSHKLPGCVSIIEKEC